MCGCVLTELSDLCGALNALRRQNVLYLFTHTCYLAISRRLRQSGNVPRNAAERCGGFKVGKDGKDAERVTTTLTRTQKAELDRLAKSQGVKVAWLVRRAVERYLEEAAGGPMLPLELERGEDGKR